MTREADAILDTLEWTHLETLRFQMGSDRLADQPNNDEGPVRGVSVGSMTVATQPIPTWAFTQFVEATDFVTTAEREGTGFVLIDGVRELRVGLTWRNPTGDSLLAASRDEVTQISWADALGFCQWTNTRLLTEAEWERAARSGLASMGDDILEWVADYYDPTFHRNEQRVNPQGPTSGTQRVCRGAGSLSARTPFLPDMSSTDITFRVIRQDWALGLQKSGRLPT